MELPLLDRWWRKGEFTLSFSQAGNSRRQLSIVRNFNTWVPPRFADSLSFAVEGDLRWVDDHGSMKYYFRRRELAGEDFIDGYRLAELEDENQILFLEDALERSEGLLYHFHLRTWPYLSRALEEVAAICKRHGRANEIWFSSHDLGILKTAKQICAKVPTMFRPSFSVGYTTYLHRPSSNRLRDWLPARAGMLKHVDIIAACPRGFLTRKEFRLGRCGATRTLQRVWDFLRPSISYAAEKGIIEEAGALGRRGKLTFPYKLSALRGARRYFELSEEYDLPIAGVCVDVPDDIDAFYSAETSLRGVVKVQQAGKEAAQR